MDQSFYFLRFEKPVAGADAQQATAPNLCYSTEKLYTLAQEAGIQPLNDYMSVSQDTLCVFFSPEEMDDENFSVPQEKWYAAAEGIAAFDALARKLSNETLLAELNAMTELLKLADAGNVRFHLSRSV